MCVHSETSDTKNDHIHAHLFAHKCDARIMNSIARDDIEDPIVLFGRTLERTLPCRNIEEHVVSLWEHIQGNESMGMHDRRADDETQMMVPGTLAQGFGSADSPVRNGASFPST